MGQKTQYKRREGAISFLIILVLVVMFSSINVYAKNMKLSKKSISLRIGESKQLIVRNNKKKVKWTSKNEIIATVSGKGNVRAKSVGTTYVVAKVGRKKLKCKVIVKKQEITDLGSYMGKTISPLLKKVYFVKDKTRYKGEGIISYYYGGGVTEKNYRYTSNTPVVDITCKGSKVTEISMFYWSGERRAEEEIKFFRLYGLKLPISIESAEKILLAKGFSIKEKERKRISWPSQGVRYDELFQNNKNISIFLSSPISDTNTFYFLECELING